MIKNICPDVQFIKLPSKSVTTNDDVQIKRGDTIYFRYAPGPAPSPYVVIGDYAVWYDKQTRIIVIGKGHVVAGMDPQDFVVDVAVWEEFYKKRYSNREAFTRGKKQTTRTRSKR